MARPAAAARLGSEGTSQRHPLLLAAGKVAGHPLGQLAGVKEFEHLRHALFARAPAKPGKTKGNIGSYIHVGKKCRPLGNKPDRRVARGAPTLRSPFPPAFVRARLPGRDPVWSNLQSRAAGKSCPHRTDRKARSMGPPARTTHAATNRPACAPHRPAGIQTPALPRRP